MSGIDLIKKIREKDQNYTKKIILIRATIKGNILKDYYDELSNLKVNKILEKPMSEILKNEIKVIFSNNDGYSGTDFIFANDIEPSIVVSNNNIYVTWYDGSPGNFEILLSKSTNGGESFNIPENISNNQGSSQEPEIALMQ